MNLMDLLRFGGSTQPQMPMSLSPSQMPQGAQRPNMFGGLQDFARNNQGLLLGLGASVMENGLNGAPRGAMQGMQFDRDRRRETKRTNQTVNLLVQRGMPEAEAQMLVGTGNTAAIGAALSPQRGAEPTSAMREYEFAQSQGFDGSFIDYRRGQAQAGRNQTTVNVGGDNVAMGEISKDVVEQSSADIDAGNSAARRLVQINELDRILASAPQGASGALAQVANNMGIRVEGGDDVAAAQAILNQMAPQQRPPGSGPMSDADLRLFQASLPRIINQPGGNQKIIEAMRAMASYDQARAQIASEYQQAIVEGQPQAQAMQRYRAQIDQLNSSTASLQDIVGSPQAQGAQRTGPRLGDDGVYDWSDWGQ